MSETTLELSSFFEGGELSAEAYERYADAAHAAAKVRERFDELTKEYYAKVEKGQGEPLRLALALLILGRFSDALEWFGKATDNKFRRFYAAQAHLALGHLDDALGDLQRAANKGWDAFEIDMRSAAIHVRAGDLAAAEKLANKYERQGADRADWHYVRGLIAERRDDHEPAIDLYEKALTLNPDHVQAMFHCAWLHDVRGNDDEAVELYQLLALQPRAHVNALMNLAVLCEDRGRHQEAIDCLRRVLRSYPNHTRARLFLKDAESSRLMVIDEGLEKRAETRNRLLDTPITEMDLSVRARNCLKKMKVNTLGELIKLTEEELLAYKNFGDTSLSEIRAVLSKRGMHLGMKPEEIEQSALVEAEPPKVVVPAGSEAALNKPVSELELSVRARRCLQRLNVATLGQLIQHSEADLLAIRNFGVTSLNEIKAKLNEMGLRLAPKRMT